MRKASRQHKKENTPAVVLADGRGIPRGTIVHEGKLSLGSFRAIEELRRAENDYCRSHSTGAAKMTIRFQLLVSYT